MIIAKFFPESGGAENQARLLSRHLQREGVNVFVLTRNYHGGPACEILEGFSIYRTPTFGGRRMLNALVYLLGCLWKGCRLRRSFDVIHCHQAYSPAITGVLLGFLCRKPVVVKITASDELGEVRELQRLPFFRLRKRLLRRVRLFFVVNPWISKELGTLGIPPQRTRWIPNGVEIPPQGAGEAQVRLRARQTLQLDPEKFVLVYSGRLSSEKGLPHLIRTVARGVEQYPRLLLLLVGGASAQRDVQEEVTTLIRDLRLASFIRLTGRVPAVTPYLLAADCFVLPSISEGMSNSLLEAMASGLPCIVSDIPAMRCLIESGEDGLTVPVGEEEPLLEAVGRLYQDRPLAARLGQRARAKIQQAYGIENVSQYIFNTYREVLK
jgi:glycosyltransferase involved in cell wall biosynthesis